MEVYRYSYTIMTALFMALWLLLYWRRKDVRMQMLFISFPLGLMGLILEFAFVTDWWRPLTLSGTVLTVESFFYSVATGGIAAVAFEELFHKHVRVRRMGKQLADQGYLRWWFCIVASLALFYTIHGAIGLNTFLTTSIILALGTAFVLLKRPDFLLDSDASGVLTLATVVVVYTITEWITPGWIEQFWLFQNVPDIIVLHVPIDDIIYYFLFGASVGPLYEFIFQANLVRSIA